MVARRRTSPEAIKFGESISSIIDEDVPSVRDKKNRAATLGTAEAEYAIKLHRMAESSSPADPRHVTVTRGSAPWVTRSGDSFSRCGAYPRRLWFDMLSAFHTSAAMNHGLPWMLTTRIVEALKA
jgi:hypothetical protein